jgi:hypothetical protein
MSRRVIALNALLLVAGVLAAAYIVRELRAPLAVPAPAPPRTASPSASGAARTADAPSGAPANYAAIAARNLFSPTRSESPPVAATPTPPVTLAKPSLHGVVLRDGAPLAYLEDPTTKRVAGYRLGDTIAGGAVQAISSDQVVIARPDGNLSVRLRDPSRPRPPAPAAAPAAAPGQPGAPPVPGQAGVTAPPAVAPAPPAVAPAPPASAGAPGVTPAPGAEVQAPTPPGTQPPGTGRRPLPPSLIRRGPPGSPSDAPSQ